MNYPLASDSWCFEERLAILKVMAKGKYTMGEEVLKFETEFAKKMGVSNAVMVNSGSSANLVGLAALVYSKQIPPGSEVIVPAVSWSTTYFPITQLGLVPVFVDIDDMTFNMSIHQVQAAFTEKTVAVLAVNLLGLPCHLKWLQHLCKQKGAYLIEDNCESLGATHYNQQAGTFGIFGTYSFFFSHHLQTMEGGMIVTNDDKLADYARSLRAHGWVRDVRTDQLYVKGTYSEFEEAFKFVLPGYCVRPLEMSGAIGRAQLKKLDRFVDARRTNALVFRSEFQDMNIQMEGFYDKSSWFGFAVIMRPGLRAGAISRLRDSGVATRPIVAGNFLSQPVMKHLPHRVYKDIIAAKHLDENGFFFGNDHRNLKDKIREVRDIIG